MKRNWGLVVGGIVVLLVVLVALAAGLAVAESGTSVESTVVTSQVGNLTSTGDDLVLRVRGDGEFAGSVSERLETELAGQGYELRVVDSLGETYESPVLVVDVTRADVRNGIVNHRATLAVDTYYATNWNATAYREYRESGSVVLRDPGSAVVGGEFRLEDRTRGLPGRYRAHLTEEIVAAVAEDFRGELLR